MMSPWVSMSRLRRGEEFEVLSDSREARYETTCVRVLEITKETVSFEVRGVIFERVPLLTVILGIAASVDPTLRSDHTSVLRLDPFVFS